MKRKIALVAVLIAIAAGAAIYWLSGREAGTEELLIYGNVDLRQVELPFMDSQRIAAVLVHEGERVRKGQVLARLDTRRLEPQYAEAQARVGAQQAVVAKLKRGNRPEEIAQARATLDAANADAANARGQYRRIAELAAISGGRATSRQDVDDARSALSVSEAKAASARQAFELATIGPRREDIAQAESQLRAEQAHLALLRQQLADAELVAPIDAVVRSRLMEPGELASPQRPVLSLAVTDPKWVRGYVAEPDLGRIRPGAAAAVAVDAFPARRFDGWIGFISPVAEFTPKSVATEELRTSLVYEVRIFVKDPDDELRLGMPATVRPAAMPADRTDSRRQRPVR